MNLNEHQIQAEQQYGGNGDGVDEIGEEYKVWKKNAPFFYDTLFTHQLTWPSLTCEWLPSKDVPMDHNYSCQKLIVGTHAAEGEANYLQIMLVKFPVVGSKTEFLPGSANLKRERITLDIQINHEDEVNKARHMPQSHNIIATKTVRGEIHIFDYFKHPTKPADNEVRPNLRLTGHEKEGYGLAWNPVNQGILLSGSDDGNICIWDVNSCPQETNQIQALEIKKGYHDNDVVEDVKWCNFSPECYYSVGDNGSILCWDRRTPEPVLKVEKAHPYEIMCMDSSPFDENIIVTGSIDRIVALWDLRNPSQWLHGFRGHEEEVTQTQFSNQHPSLLASSSGDRRVHVWDMSKIGQADEQQKDVPPELLFVHGGHTSKVSDICWNPNEPLTMASVTQDNQLHVWQMGREIYFDQQ